MFLHRESLLLRRNKNPPCIEAGLATYLTIALSLRFLQVFVDSLQVKIELRRVGFPILT